MISTEAGPQRGFHRDHRGGGAARAARAARAVAALLALLAGWIAAALLAAGPAAAHATLVSTDPTDGARLDAAPAAVTLTFSESVGVASGYLRVIDSDGNDVTAGDPFHPDDDGARLQVPLRAGLPDASYIASWRVVSEDSHVIGGSARFVVGDGPLLDAPPGAGDADVPREISVLAGAARWLGYAGLALLAGTWVLFAAVPSARAARAASRAAWTGWAAAVVSTGVAILAQGAESSGRGLGSLLDADQLNATLATGFGKLHCYALIGLGAIALLLHEVVLAAVEERRHGAPEAAGLALAAVMGTLSAGGHAASADNRVLAVAADALHLAASSIWLGGLAVLVVAVLRHQDPIDARRALRVFSPVALACVLVLLGTGTYQAWRESRSLDALLETGYGRLVLVKVALLIVLIAVAALVRRRLFGATLRLRPPANDAPVEDAPVEDASGAAPDAAPAGNRRTLRSALLAEVALGAVVLVAAAMLVGQPPARSAYAQQLQSRPASATADLGGGATVTVTFDPAAARSSTITVELDGTDAQTVELTASLPERDLGPLPIELTREPDPDPNASGGDGDGDSSTRWQGQASFPGTGEWRFSVTVRASEFDAVVAQVQVRLR